MQPRADEIESSRVTGQPTNSHLKLNGTDDDVTGIMSDSGIADDSRGGGRKSRAWNLWPDG